MKRRSLASSISYIQARNCVLAAFIVGLFLSGIQILLDFQREQNAVDDFANQILAASQFAAADATFHLDAAAAEEVARGILQYHSITRVSIVNEENLVLAKLSAQTENSSQFVGINIFGELADFSRPLHLRSGELVGRLTIYVDPALASESFIDRSILVLATGFARSILLAVILFFVFYLTTTKRISEFSHALQKLDLDNPSKILIPQQNKQDNDELDDLGVSINTMLARLSTDIDESKKRETDLRRSKDDLAYQASHDVLTGLTNRRGAETHLQKAIDNTVDELRYAFFYVDLDQFKIVNDTSGHAAGDELLRQISSLLKHNIRDNDVVTRLGGDEFGILVACQNLDEVAAFADRLLKAASNYRFVWQSKRFAIGFSIGVAPITPGIDHINTVLRNADVACYSAKDAGRNCYKVYRDDDIELDRLNIDIEWSSKISNAIDEGKFELYSQKIAPLINGASDKQHHEILIRMKNDDGTLILPDNFLPAAERFNFITKIDEWVVDNTFSYYAHNTSQLDALELCAINISGPSISSKIFQKHLWAKLEEYRIPASKICFEITETTAISNLTLATEFIAEGKKRGCIFALDDFGTGSSTFAYLKYLPVDIIKIDGIFVREIEKDSFDLALVKSISDLAKAMGKKVVAEFVESEAIASKLASLEIDYAQGHYIAKPEPLLN